MAEIKIEKKKAIWPWVLLGLMILALLIYLLLSRNQKEMVSEMPPANNLVNESNSAVTSYVAFVNADTATMSLDHSYTSQALIKLADATSAIASQIGYAMPADIQSVKAYADNITEDPYITSHADTIRKAADILSSALQQMQQAKYPSLGNEAAEVQKAAAAINPAVLTLDQRDAVKNFFKQAASLLQKMN